MSKQSRGRAAQVTSPIRAIEEEGFYAFREWPIVLMRRLKELEPQLAIVGSSLVNAPIAELPHDTPDEHENPRPSAAMAGANEVLSVDAGNTGIGHDLGMSPAWLAKAANGNGNGNGNGSIDTNLFPVAVPGLSKSGLSAVSAPSGSEQDISVAQIKVDGGTQIRLKGVDESVVKEYAHLMKSGTKFPAIVVYFDGKTYWLADGFHRVAAVKSLGQETVLAEVRSGSHRDALIFGIGANRGHGLKYSTEDKRNSIRILLLDKECTGWTDNKIAQFTGTDHKTVGTVRESLVKAGELAAQNERVVERNGSSYKINTSKIGGKREKEK